MLHAKTKRLSKASKAQAAKWLRSQEEASRFTLNDTAMASRQSQKQIAVQRSEANVGDMFSDVNSK
jgi:hypothetical protein